MKQIALPYFLNYRRGSKAAVPLWGWGGELWATGVKAFKCQISPPRWKQGQQIIIFPKRWQPNSYTPEEKRLSQLLVGTGRRLNSKPPNRPCIVLPLGQHALSGSALLNITVVHEEKLLLETNSTTRFTRWAVCISRFLTPLCCAPLWVMTALGRCEDLLCINSGAQIRKLRKVCIWHWQKWLLCARIWIC